jgi:hypothetical protein
MNNLTARIAIAITLFVAAASAHGQVLNPISFSFDTTAGETLDELGLPGDSNENSITTLGSSGDYIALQGDNPNDSSAGLPDDGTIVSASNTATKIATFQLAPYSEPNVLEGDGTLILATPASYSNLAFLVNSLSTSRVSAPATFILNFSDGSSDTLSTGEKVPNFLGGVPGAPGSSVALSTNAAYDSDGLFDIVNFDEYDFVLSAEDVAKTLVSIGISANSGDLLTYTVSGTDPPLDAPEPSTWSLLAVALAGSCLVRRLRPATVRESVR